MKPAIKKGQVWKNNMNRMQLEVIAKKNSLWKCRVLTKKDGVYAGTHTVTPYTLYHKYRLIL